MDKLHDGLRSRLDLLIDDNLRYQRRAELGWEFVRAVHRLHEAGDLPEILEQAVSSIMGLTGVRGAAISVIPALGDTTTSLYRHQGLELVEPDDLVFTMDSPFMAALQESAIILQVADLVGKTGPRSKTRAVLRRLGIESAVPLKSGETIRGLVLLTSRTDDFPLITDRLELLAAYARVVSLAIENRLLQDAR